MDRSNLRLLAATAAILLCGLPTANAQVDTDGDGVFDNQDNCIDVSNPVQRDTDNDLFGNPCDPDIAVPNDCLVNFSDLNVMKFTFFSQQDSDPATPGNQPSANWNADADMNGDGSVNFIDLNVMKSLFFNAPGPSGPAGTCLVQNLATTGIQVIGDNSLPIDYAYLGHPAQVEIGISATAPATNVTADIMILDRAAFDTDPSDPPDPEDPAGNTAFRIRVGQVTIPQVLPGTHTYPASVLIPYSDSKTTAVIVSNLDEPEDGSFDAAHLPWYAGRFVTDDAHYELKSVTFRLDPGQFPEPTVPFARLYADDGSGLPGAMIGEFENPAEFALLELDDYVFESATTIDLNPNTSYFVSIGSQVPFVSPGPDQEAQWSYSASSTNTGPGTMPGGDYWSLDQGATWQALGNPRNPIFQVNVEALGDSAAEPAVAWDPIAVGEYYLYAEIDPEDSFGESDEDDNIPLDEATGQFTGAAQIVQIQADLDFSPNVFVENLEIDIDNLGFDAGMLATALLQDSNLPENDQPGFVGVTATISSSGAYWPNAPNIEPGDRPLPIPRVEVSGGVKILGVTYPAQFWDSVTETYGSTFSILNLEPGVARSVHLDVVMESSLFSTVLLNVVNSLIGDCIPIFPPPSFLQVYNCVLEALADTQLDINIIAYDATAGGSPMAEFDPPGFAYENFWPPDLSGLWQPVVATLIPTPEAVADAAGFDPPPPPLPTREAFEYSWDKAFGGDYASAGVSFYAGLGIDGVAAPDDPAGAFAAVDGRIPIALFGFELDLYRAYFEVRGLNTVSGVPYWDNNYIDYEVRAPNSFFEPTTQLLLVDLDPLECGEEIALIPEDCTDNFCPTDCPDEEPNCACEDCDNSWDPDCDLSRCNQCRAENCLSFGVSAGVEKVFVIGVVPLTVEFSAEALVGLNATVDFPACSDEPSGPSDLVLSAGPFAEASASLDAYIDLLLAAGGATAEINLISDTFTAAASVLQLDHDATTIEGQLQMGLFNTLTGPNGEAYLWARYPCVKRCRVCVRWVGCWSIPCPGTCRATQTLASFETFERTDPLYNKETPGIVTVSRP